MLANPVELLENPVELLENPVELLENPVELLQNPVELLQNPVELLQNPVILDVFFIDIFIFSPVCKLKYLMLYAYEKMVKNVNFECRKKSQTGITNDCIENQNLTFQIAQKFLLNLGIFIVSFMHFTLCHTFPNSQVCAWTSSH